MIVRKRLRLTRTIPYIWFDLTLGLISGAAAYVLVDVAKVHALALPATIATVLGTALAILLGFRANTSYQRWWEASGIWAQLTGLSRTVTRVAKSVTDAKLHDPTVDAEVVHAWQKEIAHRQIAWAHALRCQLRGQDPMPDLSRLLDSAEVELVRNADNRPAKLLALQSRGVYSGYAKGILAGFDNFQIETALSAISTQQALAERMKATPIPRPHAYFTQLFVHVYVVVFPFAIIGSLLHYQWMAIVLAGIVAFVFSMVERLGAASELPFENHPQDVPIAAITTNLERDLLELVEIEDRPAAPVAVDGVLL